MAADFRGSGFSVLMIYGCVLMITRHVHGSLFLETSYKVNLSKVLNFSSPKKVAVAFRN